jgi:hypothetical protein
MLLLQVGNSLANRDQCHFLFVSLGDESSLALNKQTTVILDRLDERSSVLRRLLLCLHLACRRNCAFSFLHFFFAASP